MLWAEVQKESARWKSRRKIRDSLADGRRSRVVLDPLYSTDVGRLLPVEEDTIAISKVSEWERRERSEREEERRADAEAPDAEDELSAGEEPPLFLPTPSFMRSAGED